MHATAVKSGSRAGYAPRVVPGKPLSKMQKQRQNQASDVQLWNKCRSTVTHRLNWETNESKRNGLAAMGGCHYCPGLAIVDPWRPSSAHDRPENHGLTMRLNRKQVARASAADLIISFGAPVALPNMGAGLVEQNRRRTAVFDLIADDFPE